MLEGSSSIRSPRSNAPRALDRFAAPSVDHGTRALGTRPGDDLNPDADVTAIVEAASRGDSLALGALYDRFSSRIYAYIYRRCGDAALAEDLAGEVFLRMLEAIEDRRAWRRSFSGWLFRIAHNVVTDHHRRRARRPVEDLGESRSDGGAADPEGGAGDTVSLDRVRNALHGINPRYAELIVLRFADGLSLAETADVLGSTVGAVKVQQHRALKALRSRLDVESEASA